MIHRKYLRILCSISLCCILSLLLPGSIFAQMQSETALTPEAILQLAIKNGKLEEVDSVISNGLNVNFSYADAITPLHLAVIHNQEEILALLLQKGAKTDLKDNTTQATPLHFAALYGRANLAKMLIQHGADVNARMRFDITPLLVAAQFKQPQVIEILLQNGADIKQADQEGFTALHFAAQNNDEVSALMLINHKAPINVPDKSGATPFKIANYNHHQTLIDLLKDHGGAE